MSAERFLVPNNAAPGRFLSRGSIKHPTCNYAQVCRLHMNIVGAESVPIEAKRPRPEDHPGIPGQNENQNLGRSPIELFTPLARNPTSQ